MPGRSKHTVLKLLADIGKACEKYHDEHVRGISARRVQCDEIWPFCYAKQKNVSADKRGRFGYGDVWTWVAMDADTKLVSSHLVGLRDGGYATEFIRDVKDRLANRVRLTTGGHRAYLEAVEDAFGGDVDDAQLIKIYGQERAGESRYSPAVRMGTKHSFISGDPNSARVSTSYVERQNLTIRIEMRHASDDKHIQQEN